MITTAGRRQGMPFEKAEAVGIGQEGADWYERARVVRTR